MPGRWGPSRAPGAGPPRPARRTLTPAPPAGRRRRPAAARPPRPSRSSSWRRRPPRPPAPPALWWRRAAAGAVPRRRRGTRCRPRSHSRLPLSAMLRAVSIQAAVAAAFLLGRALSSVAAGEPGWSAAGPAASLSRPRAVHQAWVIWGDEEYPHHRRRLLQRAFDFAQRSHLGPQRRPVALVEQRHP